MPDLHDATRGRVLHGGDHDPERRPEETRQEDVRLMRQAGVTTVTVGVLSWARLEPRPGAFGAFGGSVPGSGVPDRFGAAVLRAVLPPVGAP